MKTEKEIEHIMDDIALHTEGMDKRKVRSVLRHHLKPRKGEIKKIKKGTIIHINGIPFEIMNDVEIKGNAGNFKLIK